MPLKKTISPAAVAAVVSRSPARGGWILYWLCLLLAVPMGTQSVHGADVREPQLHVLIDVSGSMRWTDPNNLRDPAVRLLGDLLPPQATVGMWFFGSEITPTLSPRKADNEAKRIARQVASNIRSNEPWTDIPEAMATANNHWHENTDRNIILLSDGMVDISPDEEVNRRATERLFTEIIPRLVEADVRVHTIALSDEADTTVLEQIARQTGGMSVVAKTDADLQRAFMDLFETAAPRVGLPLVDNRFAVDEHVEELTLVVFREPDAQPTQIQMPDETVHDQQSGTQTGWRWDAAAGRDLITIENPPTGRWAILAETDPDNRAMIITDLSLRMQNLPSRIYPEEILDSSLILVNRDQELTRAELTEHMQAEVKVENHDGQAVFTQPLNDQGREPDILGGDGRFDYRLILDEPSGTYTVIAQADGPTFSRVIKQKITLAPQSPLLVALDGHYEDQDTSATDDVAEPSTPEWLVEVAIEFDPTIIEASSPVFSGHWNCPGVRREPVEQPLTQTPTFLSAPQGFFGPDCFLQGEIRAQVQENRSITVPIKRELPEPSAREPQTKAATPEQPVAKERTDNPLMATIIGLALLLTMGLVAFLLKSRAARQRAELIKQAHT